MTAAQAISYADSFFTTFREQTRLQVSEWAERYRVLPRQGSAEPGPWRNDRTPYLVEIMDTLSSTSKAKEVVFCKGSQIGATEAALNWLMYLMDHVGGPILALQPTQDNASEWSKQRISTSLELCEQLRHKIKPAKSRDSGNTILSKEFVGGQLFLSGANSPNALASKPIGNIYGDEIDRYPGSVGDEGDPLYLVAQRAATFPRAKRFFTSTPTLLASSRIWDLYQKSDQRVYEVPRPFCGLFQEITLDNLVWKKNDYQSARLRCEGCGELIDEFHKTKMLANGTWRAKNPGHERIGFHLSSLYSPVGWLSWADIARRHDEAHGDSGKMTAFWNTILGLPWEEDCEAIAADYLQRRIEKYNAEVPDGVLAITVAVDVQSDRIECEAVGWGEGEESWGLEYRVFQGNPGVLESGDPLRPSVWERLTEFRRRLFQFADGYQMPVKCTTIDSGGNHTDTVYDYARQYRTDNVWAVKGGSQPTKPFMNKPTRSGKGRVWVYVLGVDKGKHIVFDRLKIDKPGPGYCHFPDDENRGYNSHYYAGLIAEKKKEVTKKGVDMVIWELPKNAHNEPFDIRVYALAALRRIFRRGDWERWRAERYSKTVVQPVQVQAEQAPAAVPPAPRGPGVIDNSPPQRRVVSGISIYKV